MRLIAAILVVLTLSPAVLAEVTVSFPLQGYYRPGRVMPVVVQGGAGGSAWLVADGAVPTEVIAPGAQPDTPLPWLPLAELRNPRIQVGSVERPIEQPLHVLTPRERLIGVAAGLDGTRLRALYPDGTTVIQCPIDWRLLSYRVGWKWQWETFDAVLLEAALLDDEVAARLLGAGVTIALAAEGRPDDVWPWRRVGDVWVVDAPLLPADRLVMPQAYVPVQAWAAGRPSGDRRQIVVMAALVSIVLLTVSLWRHRSALLAAVLVVAVFCSVAYLWSRGRGTVVARSGTISITGDTLGVRDTWIWVTSLEPVTDQMPLDLRPVAASLRHVETTGLRLKVKPMHDHEPGEVVMFRFDLRPGVVLALRDRIVVSGADGRGLTRDTASGGLLMPFVRSAYLVPGTSILGASVPRDDEHDLGHVVLRYERPE